MMAGRRIILVGDSPNITLTAEDWAQLSGRTGEERHVVTDRTNLPLAMARLARFAQEELLDPPRRPEPRYTARGEAKRRPWAGR